MRQRLLVVFAALLAIVSAGSFGTLRSTNVAAAASTLAVSGNHLVDNGQTVILRGVNRSGSEYACYQNFGFFDGPSDDASIVAIAAWGSNAVRVPLNEDCWLGINGVPAAYSGANYQAAISGFVTRLRAHGLYVILTSQVAGPGTTKSTTILPMPDADHTPTFWAQVATTFKSDKGVIFDLYNEPHDVSWSCWANGCLVTGGTNWIANYQAAGMNSLTAAIRGTGATNVIMIEGLSWSYDIGGWLANRPNDGQLIAAIHNYGVSGWDTPAIWNNIYAPTALQVPVTFGEMGFDVYVETIMPWADAHGIGYLAWTWDTWGTREALISNYNGTPTTYGLGFKNYLASLSTPTAPTVSSLSPNTGPAAGGTSVTITGTNFTGATAVKFGTTAAATFAVTNATQISATSPAGTGTVDVTVTTGVGTSVTSTADRFTYTSPPPPAPTVTSLAPTSGPAAGGTPVTITGTNFTGASSVKFGTAAATFSVTNATQISATSPAGTGTVDVTVTTSGGTSATSTGDRFTFTIPPPPPPSVYTALPPTRLLDTRNAGGALGPGASRNLGIGGAGSVPMNATSVILNVTVTNTTAASSLTLYPTGNSLPLASNLNWVPGQTVPNLVSVRLGSSGSVTIYNPSGQVDVIVDLEGFFAPSVSGTAGQFVTLPPARITDTRAGSGQPNAGMTLSPYSTLTVQVRGAGNVPLTGAQAVVLNVTVTGTTANGGYLIAYPAGQPAPLASNLNWNAGQTIPNRVVVPIGAGGKVSFTNAGGSTQLIVDVNGYFTDGTAGGLSFATLTPSRILDTRNGTGGVTSKVGPGGTIQVQVSGQGGVPAMGSAIPPKAVILNVTVVNPTAFGWFIIYPDGTSQPLASDLNFSGGQIVPNLVVVKLGTNGKIDLFNANGTSDAVVDVEGWFG